MNDEDLVLLRRLAGAFARADGVPADVRLAAERAGLRPRTAGLWLDPCPAPAFRGVGEVLAFRAGDVRMEVSTEFDGVHTRLTGIVEAQVTTVTVEWPDGARDVAVDDVGRFTADHLPAGPLCLSVRLGDTTAGTRWFVP